MINPSVPWSGIELHAHLSGCVKPRRVAEFLASAGLTFETETAVRDMELHVPRASLEEYLAAWKWLRKVPSQEDMLELWVDSAVGYLAEAGFRYVEVRHSIVTVADMLRLDFGDMISVLCASLRRASVARGLDVRLIVAVTREGYVAEPARVARLLDAVTECRRDPTLVGLDLAGNELRYPRPDALGRLLRSAQARSGLALTVHAGEPGTPNDVETIRWALDECQARRIGHGLASRHDSSLLRRLGDDDIPLEVSITSSWITGAVPSRAAYPLAQLVASGAPIVMCTDNPALHGITWAQELQFFSEALSAVGSSVHVLADPFRHRFVNTSASRPE